MERLEDYSDDELKDMSPTEFVEKFSYLKDSTPEERENFAMIEEMARNEQAAQSDSDLAESASYVQSKYASDIPTKKKNSHIFGKIFGFLFGRIVYPAFIIFGCIILFYRLIL